MSPSFAMRSAGLLLVNLLSALDPEVCQFLSISVFNIFVLMPKIEAFCMCDRLTGFFYWHHHKTDCRHNKKTWLSLSLINELCAQ